MDAVFAARRAVALPAFAGRGWRASAFTPVSMFAGGFDGGYYNTQVLSSLWKDTAGTDPATVGSPVARRDDLSGNGRHQVQATAAARPMLRQDGNGKYYLEHDGVDDNLASAATFTFGQPCFMLGVATRIDDSSDAFLGPRRDSTNYFRMRPNTSGRLASRLRGSTFNAGVDMGTTEVSGAWPAGTSKILHSQVANDTLDCFTGNTQVGSSAEVTALGANTITLCALVTTWPITFFMAYNDYGQLVINKNLSPAERAQVLSFFSDATAVPL